MITREAMMLLENSLTFTKFVTRKYDDRYAQTGAKIGAQLDLRLPMQDYDVQDGPNLNAQDWNEQFVPLVVNKQKHIDVSFSSVELTLSIQDFSERVLAPQVVRLANQIDSDGLALLSQVYQSVGTPGTPNTTVAPFLQAGVVLDHAAVPRDTNARNIVLGPQGQADIVGGLTNIFNDQDTVAKQYLNGTMGRALGFKFSMDQNIPTLTNGPMGGTPAVNGAAQTGATLLVDAWTAAAASRLLGGEIFTLPTVVQLNPITKASTGKLQQFTVVSAVSSAADGTSSLTISPEIIVTGPKRNVSNSPADGAALTFVGTANLAVPAGVAFHKGAFALACVDLEDMAKFGCWGARISDSQLGISMRIARQYAISTDSLPCRVDILYGWKVIRPSMACRILGSNT